MKTMMKVMMQTRKLIQLTKFVPIIAVVIFCNSYVNAQIVSENCGQTAKIRNPLLQEAEKQQFNVLHVEFVGQFAFSGRKLFAITGPIISEGDIFSIRRFRAAVRKLSEAKIIWPLRYDDTEVRLKPQTKQIDITFCVKERHK
jgi:hypothetical protein